MRPLVILFLFLGLQWGCSQKVVENMPMADFGQALLKDAILIDVRTPEEYAEGHLENAQNINWYATDFAEQFEGMDKGKTVYVYCKVGGRSAKAQEKLRSLGFEHVVNLEGGYDAVKTREEE
ncbi:MAG TPA: rhodanese-like domain-containing protein [Arenibacter sp.]|nr:rhodanese-like domain-containing protein [Arenibacter sp.]